MVAGRRRARGRVRRLASRRRDPDGNARLRGKLASKHADRRRPAHAHRPLLRLRHAGRGAAGGGAGAGAGRDRDHRPQRDLRGPRRAREGGRDQGDRRRGGQDRRAGRGDRPVHRGEDPARDDASGDDRRDQAPGRARVRPAPVRPAALGPRLRAPAGRARRRRRDRGLQPAGRDLRVQRRGGAVRGQVPDPGRRRLGRARAPGARLGPDPDARLRRPRRVPGVAARRRHRAQPGQPAVRAGAEVPADEGASRSGPTSLARPARAARHGTRGSRTASRDTRKS